MKPRWDIRYGLVAPSDRYGRCAVCKHDQDRHLLGDYFIACCNVAACLCLTDYWVEAARAKRLGPSVLAEAQTRAAATMALRLHQRTHRAT